MRIAVISDIHANLPALKAVLNDIDNKNIDLIVCLGDLVDFAPWTNEVIEIIRSLCIPTIMGNHDERIAFDVPVVPLVKHSSEETQARTKAINYTKNTITSANKEYLASLPKKMELSYNDLTLYFTHASPTSIDEYIYETDIDTLKERIVGLDTDALVIGHTHISYIKDISGVKIINVGSVGRSKEPDNKASYGVLEIVDKKINCEIIKINYPVEEVISEILKSAIPDFYANFFLNK